MITGKLYNWLKWFAQIVLPALGTLYFTLAGIWDLDGAEKVVGSIMAFDFFLGVLLGISQVSYNKGVIQAGNVVEGEDGKLLFEVNQDQMEFDSLAEQNEVRFKVKTGEEAA